MANKTNEIFEEIKQLNDEISRLQAQCQQIRLKYQKNEGIIYSNFNHQYCNYFINKRKG